MKILCSLFPGFVHKLLILDALKSRILRLKKMYNITPLRDNSQICEEGIKRVSTYNKIKFWFIPKETDILFQMWGN